MPITLLNEQSTKLPSKYVSPYLQIGVVLSPHQRNFFVRQMVDVYIASQLVKGQRTQVCDFLSHKWHIYCNKFPSPRLRKPNRRGSQIMVRAGGWWSLGQTVLRVRLGCCICELIATVVACTILGGNQASQHSTSLGGGRGHYLSPLTEVLMIFDWWWGKRVNIGLTMLQWMNDFLCKHIFANTNWIQWDK